MEQAVLPQAFNVPPNHTSNTSSIICYQKLKTQFNITQGKNQQTFNRLNF